ncbi:hypothetical protein SDC9_27469 [bioreactor metagenome]|uniref:Uncharacterized protein n=1 Tax=bioreactor metagenome TaxID=1076179 RepID=A0A644URM7_9ZZZZ|nr:hypothetical protein [Negativicutes bacterium]
MRQVWLQIFGVMIGGSIVKFILPNVWLWVFADLLVLGISYILLRRYPFVDMKKSMLFIGGLTLINILIDVQILDGMLGSIASLILVSWVVFGGGGQGKGKGKSTLRHKWNK